MIKGSGDLPLPDKTLIVCISGISVNNEEAQEAIQSRSLQPCLSLTVEVLVLFCEDRGIINNRNQLWVIGGLRGNIPVFAVLCPVRLWQNYHSEVTELWQKDIVCVAGGERLIGTWWF